MAEPQLYIIVAILITIPAIVSTFIREPVRFQTKTENLNRIAVGLMFGTWVGTVHISVDMMFRNNIDVMSIGAVLGFIAHWALLAFIPVLASMWYWLVGKFVKSPTEFAKSSSSTSNT